MANKVVGMVSAGSAMGLKSEFIKRKLAKFGPKNGLRSQLDKYLQKKDSKGFHENFLEKTR